MNRFPVWMIAVFAAGSAFGQTTSPPLAFEVASVKMVGQGDLPDMNSTAVRATGMPGPSGGGVNDPSLVTYSAVTLKMLLARAYGLHLDQVSGPAWLETERYNIAAKIPDGAPKDSSLVMLQNLLTERFQLTLHIITKPTQGYTLVVGKTPLKITKSADQESTVKKTSGFTSSGHLTWKGHTMVEFANSLSIFLTRPVSDMTGLAGRYDMALDASPDSIPGLRAFAAPNPDADPLPTIFAAIRGLGLNLEPRDTTAKQLIVDSANKVPTQN
jgi:uncharacterized protein (TIGR03435 family)